MLHLLTVIACEGPCNIHDHDLFYRPSFWLALCFLHLQTTVFMFQQLRCAMVAGPEERVAVDAMTKAVTGE